MKKSKVVLITLISLLVLWCVFVIGGLYNENSLNIISANVTVDELKIPDASQNQSFEVNEESAGSIAEGLIRANKGWLVVFNKPFTASYDDNKSVWIVQCKSSFLGSILGAWGETTFIIGKNGEIEACFSTPF